MNLEKLLLDEEIILTEGAIVERLRRNTDYLLDNYILNAGFIYDNKKRNALRKIYQSYLNIGRAKKMPIFIFSPTWRANVDRIKLSQYKNKNVNRDNILFLRNLASEYGHYEKKIIIAGMIGCKGNAYNPLDALSSKEAYNFHSPQLHSLADTDADILFAVTMPAISEIQGIVKICSEIKKPYAISFIVKNDGRLLDGTSISDAIKETDSSAASKPMFYMVNCVHPRNLIVGLQQPCNDISVIKGRLLGLQANASDKSPEELDMSKELYSDTPESLANYMAELKNVYGFKIFGGCCGTNENHILTIAKKVSDTTLKQFQTMHHRRECS